MYRSSTHPRDDATTTGFDDRHVVPARLGRDGQRRVPWIVWRNSVALSSGSDLKDNCFPEQAVDKHQECEAIVNAKNSSESLAKAMAATNQTPRSMDYEYLCLPDTADPREPKGQ